MSKQILIGLCGPAGCGKDTVADLLVKHGAFHKYALASPIKQGLEAMFGLTPDVWDDREMKETVLPWLGKSPRQLAQTLGTEWGRQHVHTDLWMMLGMRRWDLVRQAVSPRLVISDVRFDNEAQAIKQAGGTVWLVEREGIASVAAHVSEKGVSPALIEGRVKNSGSLDQLDANIQHWFSFLMKRYAK
jgi:post-segregation antitoxin (ccd killing protein)